MKIYSIRSGRREDLPRLADIERDAAQRFRDVGYVFCAEGPVHPEADHLRALENGAIFVAETTSHKPIGFALLWRVDNAAHLLEVAVIRTKQGQGVGRRLIAQCEAWARAKGFQELTLNTYRDVAWNAPLYERLGYRPFEPESWRSGLLAIRAQEAAFGFDQRPRITMRKLL